MKAVWFTALVAVAGVAGAQNIQWRPVTPGPMEFSAYPNPPRVVIQNQIGPLTFGSDGSRSYTPGDQEQRSPVTGELVPRVFYQRNNEGRLVLCRKYGDNMFCE